MLGDPPKFNCTIPRGLGADLLSHEATITREWRRGLGVCQDKYRVDGWAARKSHVGHGCWC